MSAEFTVVTSKKLLRFLLYKWLMYPVFD